MFDTALTAADFAFLARGAGMTIVVTLISVIAGTILGIVFGVFRYQVGPIWAAPLTFVLDVFRSIPLLIQLVLANAFMGMVLRWQLSGFTVACGDGAVEVLEAQREGKRPMPAAEVLRGLTLPDRLD